jgi:hypothetical protein
LLVVATLWILTGAALTLPPLLRAVPRGVVAHCESECRLARRPDGSSGEKIARARLALRDGRVLELDGSDFPCECSCNENVKGPSWCLPPGAFIEKRRGEFGFRTDHDVLPWRNLRAMPMLLVLSVLWCSLLARWPSGVELLRRHAASAWLSPGQQELLTAQPHVLLVLVPALVAARVLNPLVYAAVGLAWACGLVLFRRRLARRGLPGVTGVVARRLARRHSHGVALVGRFERGRLVTASGQAFVIDLGAAAWLGNRPALMPEGGLIEAVGGVRPQVDPGAERLERESVVVNVLGPLDGRPLLCRARS